jgi:glycosyltransferase involved in cell wall biosynthesis
MGPGGVLVEPRNPKQLAEVISGLLQNPPLRQEMGKLGRAHIQNNFGLQSMIDKTINAYKSIQ